MKNWLEFQRQSSTTLNAKLITFRIENWSGICVPFLIKQVNVSSCSCVAHADHCTQYALSDSTDPSFKSTCSHGHFLRWRCQDLKDMPSDINMAIQRSQFEQDYDKEDATHTFQEAVRAIQLWKSQQLRLLNQDAAHHILIASIVSTTIVFYLLKTGPWSSCRSSTGNHKVNRVQRKGFLGTLLWQSERTRVRWKRKPLYT